MQAGIGIHKVRDLSPEIRRAVQALLGRELHEDENVAIQAFKGNIAKPAPTGSERTDAFRDLRARIDATSERALGLPEADIDNAIDEAVDHVRHNRG